MTPNLQFNWNNASQLLSVFAEFYQMKQDEQPIELTDAISKIAGAVGIDDPESALRNAANKQLGEVLDSEGAEKIAGIVAEMYEPVMKITAGFVKGDMEPRAVLDGLNDIYLGSLNGLEETLGNALGFKIPDALTPLLEKYELAAISIYCFAAAYKIYRKAADDAAIAHEHRIEIERLCNESIMQLKKHRGEMEELVNKYMIGYLMPFAHGVSAMDEALLSGDDEGYIKANADLWALLGRTSQYHNRAEFDDLMASDESFKL